MGSINVRLPDSIHRHIKEIAQREGVSINQFISSAVTEKVSALLTEDVLEARAKKAPKAQRRFQENPRQSPGSPTGARRRDGVALVRVPHAQRPRVVDGKSGSW